MPASRDEVGEPARLAPAAGADVVVAAVAADHVPRRVADARRRTRRPASALGRCSSTKTSGKRQLPVQETDGARRARVGVRRAAVRSTVSAAPSVRAAARSASSLKQRRAPARAPSSQNQPAHHRSSARRQRPSGDRARVERGQRPLLGADDRPRSRPARAASCSRVRDRVLERPAPGVSVRTERQRLRPTRTARRRACGCRRRSSRRRADQAVAGDEVMVEKRSAACRPPA